MCRAQGQERSRPQGPGRAHGQTPVILYSAVNTEEEQGAKRREGLEEPPAELAWPFGEEGRVRHRGAGSRGQGGRSTGWEHEQGVGERGPGLWDLAKTCPGHPPPCTSTGLCRCCTCGFLDEGGVALKDEQEGRGAMTAQVQHDLQYLGEQARGAELGPKNGTPPDTATAPPAHPSPPASPPGAGLGPKLTPRKVCGAAHGLTLSFTRPEPLCRRLSRYSRRHWLLPRDSWVISGRRLVREGAS